MIVSDIGKYMKAMGRVSLDDLVIHFDGEKTAIEGIMETLVHRGQVLELGCGGCGGKNGCSVAGPKIYAYAASCKIKKTDDGMSICS